MKSLPFYSPGIAFECSRCGKCCSRAAGDLYLTAPDVRQLSGALSLSDEEFLLRYCELVDLELAIRVSLVTKESGECVFFGASGCEVYEHRPLQCRTFPFWSINLLDQDCWQRTASECPGIGEGRHWSRQEIDEVVALRETEPLLDVNADSSDG